jgi:multidrug efflux pump subunit AcrA (membrane-fusion protein)
MSIAAREQPRPRVIPWVSLGIGAALIILALGLWGYFATRPETNTVVRRDITVTLPLEGEVVAPPSARADIMAPYRAPVARVFASVGDRVSKGDVLVELSYPSAQAGYAQARQELQAARQAHQSARQQYDDALTEARKRLEQARATERQARQAASTTTSAAAGAEPPAAPAEPAVSLSQATQARIDAEQAVLQAEADLEAALTPYQQRLEAAEAAFQAAQSGRKMAQIKSPIYGTVLALNARPGQEIGADAKTPVAVVVDLGDLQVHAPADANETAVHPDAPVTFTLDKLPGQQFEGQVERVTSQPAKALQGDRHLAIIEFENKEGLAKPEMKAHVEVIVSKTHDALAVPSDAVDRDASGRPTVQVLRNGRWQKVVVQPGLSDGQYTAIRSGLEANETIRVTPNLL